MKIYCHVFRLLLENWGLKIGGRVFKTGIGVILICSRMFQNLTGDRYPDIRFHISNTRPYVMMLCCVCNRLFKRYSWVLQINHGSSIFDLKRLNDYELLISEGIPYQIWGPWNSIVLMPYFAVDLRLEDSVLEFLKL